MTKRRSLRLRVTIAAGGLIAAVLIIGAVALAGLLRRALEQDTQALLNQQMDEVVNLAVAGELPRLLVATGREIGQLQVYDSQGTLIAATRGFAETAHLNIIDPPTTGASSYAIVSGDRIDSDHGERYRVAARGVDTPTGHVSVYGVSSLSAADNAVRTVVLALLAGVPLFVGLSGWVLWRSVGRALKPVDAMCAEVDDIEASSLERRLSAPATDDEIGKLAKTLNHLLDRLDADARRQRQFAADASHELRSPLAAARTQLEVGLAYPDRADWHGIASDALIEIDRLERLSRELLEFARADAQDHIVRMDPVDLIELTHRIIASHPAGSTPITWQEPDEPVWVRGDDDLLTRMLRNLISNAERHAHSRVDVEVCGDVDQAWVRVVNDGPAISDNDRERIFEAFTRLDAARARDAGGAGLGLTISRKIALKHGGDLRADPRADGASFTLWLPAAKPPAVS